MLTSATEHSNVFSPDFDWAKSENTFTSSVTLAAAHAARLGSALNLICLSQMVQQDRWQQQTSID